MLVSNAQLADLKEILLKDFTKKMFFSLIGNLGLEKVKPFEIERESIHELILKAIYKYNIVSENLIEDFILISYQYSNEINLTGNTAINNILIDDVKSENLKIDELFTFCLTL